MLGVVLIVLNGDEETLAARILSNKIIELQFIEKPTLVSSAFATLASPIVSAKKISLMIFTKVMVLG